MRRALLFGFLFAVVGAAALWHAARFGEEGAATAAAIRGGPQRAPPEEDSILLALGGGPALRRAPRKEPEVPPSRGIEAARDGSRTDTPSAGGILQPGENEILVRAGDCLSRIVRAHYGEARPSLIEAVRRRNALSNPDRLREGIRLVLPAARARAAP